MNYVGIDLHRRFSQIHVYNDVTEKEFSRKIMNDKTRLAAFFNTLGSECKVAIEATPNWYWLVDLLSARGLDVCLSNPVQTKAIAKARVKNDKVDAKMLAHLLRADLLPTCWIPGSAERCLRDMLRMRLALVCKRTQFKNMIRMIMAKFNVTLNGNIWSGGSRDALEKLVLAAPYKECIDQLLVHIDQLTDQIMVWDEQIVEQVEATDDSKRLLAIPGIGPLSALTIIYESGPIERFPDAKHYVSYAGLVPRCCGSAGKYWNGPLFKQANMHLKRIYMEVALSATRARLTDQRLKTFYQRIRRRKGINIARVALARKIAGIVYHMSKNKIDYETCMARNTMAE